MLVKAPWTDEEVAKLNEFQETSWMHPFTCVFRGDDHEGEGVLVATNAGWVCPQCEYTQNWAHDFMLEGAPPMPSFGGRLAP